MKPAVAKYIVDTLNDSIGQMDGLLFDVKDDVNEEEYLRLKREVARAMGVIQQGILSKLADQYPELDIRNKL